MITLDQVLLLQEKVESAVAKIAQLKAENDALRSKCAELTNALSAKTEQFSTFEADQSKIEHGILQALERLNAVENAVLGNAVVEAAGVPAASSAAPVSVEPVQEAVTEEPSAFTEPAVQEAAPEEAYTAPASVEPEVFEAPAAPAAPESFAEPADYGFEQENQQTYEPSPAEEDPQQGQFDIF